MAAALALVMSPFTSADGSSLSASFMWARARSNAGRLKVSISRRFCWRVHPATGHGLSVCARPHDWQRFSLEAAEGVFPAGEPPLRPIRNATTDFRLSFSFQKLVRA